MAPIVTEVRIARPPEEVFAYVTDPSRFTEWQRGVVGARIDGDGPAQVGSRCVMTRRIGGADRTTTSEITEMTPPRTWADHGLDGPIRATVTVRVDPVDGGPGSLVTIGVDFEGHGMGRLLVPLFVRPQARREMSANCQALKRRLEGQAGG